VLVYCLCVIYIGASALSLGASLISPAAENHSTPRRLAALVLLGIFIAVQSKTAALGDAAPMFMMIIIAPAIMIALTEATTLLPTVVAPFRRFGPAGRIAGVFLYPGLASGVFFTVLVSGVATAAAHWNGGVDVDVEVFISFLACLGGLLLPAVIQRFFFKGEGQRFANYPLLLIAALVLAGILGMLTSAMANRELLWLFIWNPWVMLAMMDMSGFDDADVVVAGMLVNLAFLVILLAHAVKIHMRQMAALDRSGDPLPPDA
jgi:hypothetical protein